MKRRLLKQPSVLPGFGLSLGYTLTYLSLIVLIPLAMLFVNASRLTWAQFHDILTDPEVISAFEVSFLCALVAAVVNAVFGFLTAWVIVRYRFPGRRLLDGMIDLPFALPTAVAGLVLSTLFSTGDGAWFGSLGDNLASAINSLLVHVAPKHPLDPSLLSWLNLSFSNTRVGICIALIFVSLPFVVRTVQPVLEDLDTEFEQAAASLGAGRWQTFIRVILPEVRPALLAGFAMAFARALGEYGSVVFISSNLPMQTEIVPTEIYSKLEEFNYPGATAIAAVMLVASFLLLLIINVLERRAGRATT
jgi:sulfate/thiosulfate transport system permease protein